MDMMWSSRTGFFILVFCVIFGDFSPVNTDIDLWQCIGSDDWIRSTYVCDSDLDCPNGVDEHINACNKTECHEREFHCGSGVCMVARWVCDGDEDCFNGEDESNCTKEKVECGIAEWSCGDGDCITENWLCDGDSDCDDGSDESKEACYNRVTCSSEYTTCYSPALCMPSGWICDGNQDCNDGSDEANCTTNATTLNPLTCGDEITHSCTAAESPVCLGLDLQCDGYNDCDDGSDEGGKCNEPCVIKTSATDPSACQQICNKTPTGPKCSCKDGYRLLDNHKHCEDINECEDGDGKIDGPILCEQECINLNGSYKCACANGYTLYWDGRTCKADGNQTPVLHFGVGTRIRKFELKGEYRHGLAVNDSIHYTEVPQVESSVGFEITDIDYEWSTETLVWLESSEIHSVIKSKTPLNPEKVLLKVDSELALITGISIDWIGHNVFFSSTSKNLTDDLDARTGKIGLVPMQGNDSLDDPREVIHGVAENFKNLKDIVVVASKGMVIACEYHRFGRIIGLSMDGWQAWVHHRTIPWPNSLAYDIPRDTIYWSQLSPSTDPVAMENNIISSMQFDGTNHRVVVNQAVPFLRRPSSIAVFESRLYWYDIERYEIMSIDKVDGRNHLTIAKLFKSNGQNKNKTYPVIVSHQAKQPVVDDSSCRERNCQHSCVLTSNDLSQPPSPENLEPACVCPNHKHYFRLKKTCREQKENPFLLTKERGAIRRIYTNGTISVTQILESHSATSILFDYSRSRIYFSGSMSGIFYVNIDDPNPKSYPMASYSNATRHITLDPISGNVYWIDSKDCTIKVIPPKASPRKVGQVTMDVFPERTVVTPRSGKCPKGLAFDLHRNKLYFIDFPVTGPALYSASPGGGNLTRIQSVSPSMQIVHMTYDPYDDKIVYVGLGNFNTVLIFSLKIQENDFSLYQAPSASITGVAASPTLLYTYSAEEDSIWSQSKKKIAGGRVEKLNTGSSSGTPERHRGGGLVYVDPDLIESEAMLNPCWVDSLRNPNCSHFCFPDHTLPEKYKCGCADGFVLSSDGASCYQNPCQDGQYYCYERPFNPDKVHRNLPENNYPDCISRYELCDGQMDCYTASDEAEDVCGCQSPDFRQCKYPEDDGIDSNTGKEKIYQCVETSYFCDGDIDCANRADEYNCPCNKTTHFLCPEKDGELALCISTNWVNDGEEDCIGGGDEKFECFNEEFQCGSQDQCVGESMRCDGVEDCDDATDELDCPGGRDETSTSASTTSVVATTTTTSTTTTQTTPEETTKTGCRETEYTCLSGGCINIVAACNNVLDCADGSDEGGSCSVECEAHHCNGSCNKTPRGPFCPCKSGYSFDDSIGDCKDKDECQTKEAKCEHICTNTDGSYKCSCIEGYKIEFGYKCKAEGNPPFLIAATNTDLRLFTARSQLHYEVIPIKFDGELTEISPSALAMKGENEIFWIEGKTSRLYLTNVWSWETTLLAKLVPPISAMAWDWVGKNLFWATEKSIEIVTSDGRYSDEIIKFDDKITSIVLHPEKSSMYFSSVNSEGGGEISYCRMDGMFCEVFAEDLTESFGYLTIDQITGRLYWVTTMTYRIESSPTDKFERKERIQAPAGMIITGLVVFEQLVTWTETDLKNGKSNVYSIDKQTFDTASQITVRSNIPATHNLAIVQELNQPAPVINYCGSSSACTFFCINEVLPGCHCPTKKLHAETEKTVDPGPCRNIPVCSHPVSKNGDPLVVESIANGLGGQANVLCPKSSKIYSIICQYDGSWKPDPPDCEQIPGQCSLPVVEYGILITSDGEEATSEKYDPGTEIQTKCKEGFEVGISGQKSLVKSAVITCGVDGKWDPENYQCIMITQANQSQQIKNKENNDSVVIAVIIVIAVLLIVLGVFVWWKFRGFHKCLFLRKSFARHKLTDGEIAGMENPGFIVSYTAQGQGGEDDITLQPPQ